jgi:hypothetical protein
MAASISLRVYTGAGAATESAGQAGIDLVSADNALNSGANRTAHEVAPGTNSFEKWMKIALDAANGQAVSSFWVERTGDLPDGVIVKVGTTDTGATPKAALSTVATETMHEGRRYWFDGNEYSEDGDRTRYLVIQEQVAASAADGSIETQTFEWGCSVS